jgi:hypothetical protein
MTNAKNWFEIFLISGFFVITLQLVTADLNESQFNLKQELKLPLTSVPVPFMIPINTSLCALENCADFRVAINGTLLFHKLFDLNNDGIVDHAFIYSLPLEEPRDSNFSYERKDERAIITYNNNDFIHSFLCYEIESLELPFYTYGDFVEKEDHNIFFHVKLNGTILKNRSDFFFYYDYVTKKSLYKICPISFRFLEKPKLVIINGLAVSDKVPLKIFNLNYFENTLTEVQDGNLILILYKDKIILIQKPEEYFFTVSSKNKTLEIHTCTHKQNDHKILLNGTNLFAFDYSPSNKNILDIMVSFSSHNVTFGPLIKLNASLIKEQELFLIGEIQRVEPGVYRAKIGGIIKVLENTTINQNISLESINVTDGLNLRGKKHNFQYDSINNLYDFDVLVNFVGNPLLYPFDEYMDVLKVEPSALRKTSGRFSISLGYPFILEYYFHEGEIQVIQKRNVNFFIQFFIPPLITIFLSLFVSKKSFAKNNYKKILKVSILFPTLLGIFLNYVFVPYSELISIGSFIYIIVLVIPIIFAFKLKHSLYEKFIKKNKIIINLRLLYERFKSHLLKLKLKIFN